MVNLPHIEKEAPLILKTSSLHIKKFGDFLFCRLLRASWKFLAMQINQTRQKTTGVGHLVCYLQCQKWYCSTILYLTIVVTDWQLSCPVHGNKKNWNSYFVLCLSMSVSLCEYVTHVVSKLWYPSLKRFTDIVLHIFIITTASNWCPTYEPIQSPAMGYLHIEIQENFLPETIFFTDEISRVGNNNYYLISKSKYRHTWKHRGRKRPMHSS